MSAFRWIPGVAISAVAHGGLGVLVLLGTEPEPVEAPRPQPSSLQLGSYEVRSQTPQAKEPDSEATEERPAEGQRARVSGVRSDRATDITAREAGPPMQSQTPAAAQIRADATASETPVTPVPPDTALAEQVPAGDRLPVSSDTGGATIGEIMPDAPKSMPTVAQPDRVEAAAATENPIQAASVPAQTALTENQPTSEPLLASAPPPAAVRPARVPDTAKVAAVKQTPETLAAATTSVATDRIATARPEAITAPAQPVPAQAARTASPTTLAATTVATAPSSTTVTVSQPDPAPALTEARPAVRPSVPVVPPTEPVQVAANAQTPLRASPAPTRVAFQPEAPASVAPPAAVEGAEVPSQRPARNPAISTTPATVARPAANTPASEAADSAQTALAWSGSASDNFDPVSLATVQSFMAPKSQQNVSGPSVRDDLGAALDTVPCSRLQAAFVPETGALEIRGHIPDDSLRAQIVSGIQERIGPAILVGDNLLVLPDPQCNLLLAVASLGLPQSTEQSDDPLVVGKSAHAARVQLEGGDPLSLRFKSPDYPAFVYIDYFDSTGTVWHLLPRTGRSLDEHEPATWVELNASEELASGQYLVVGPPYGQDIAVALASNQRIFAQDRPLSEDAPTYLEALTRALSEARKEPGFKGEWFYLFVETRAP